MRVIVMYLSHKPKEKHRILVTFAFLQIQSRLGGALLVFSMLSLTGTVITVILLHFDSNPWISTAKNLVAGLIKTCRQVQKHKGAAARG